MVLERPWVKFRFQWTEKKLEGEQIEAITVRLSLRKYIAKKGGKATIQRISLSKNTS